MSGGELRCSYVRAQVLAAGPNFISLACRCKPQNFGIGTYNSDDRVTLTRINKHSPCYCYYITVSLIVDQELQLIQVLFLSKVLLKYNVIDHFRDPPGFRNEQPPRDPHLRLVLNRMPSRVVYVRFLCKVSRLAPSLANVSCRGTRTQLPPPHPPLLPGSQPLPRYPMGNRPAFPDLWFETAEIRGK